jgi:hypothetical protein
MQIRFMPATVLSVLAAAAPLCLSCSSNQGTADDNDALIVPRGVQVMLEEGGAGQLELYGLTLRDEPDGLHIYAALNNTGYIQACDAALKVTLNDKAGQPLGNFINGLDTRNFYLYTLPDGSTTIAACVSVGDMAMTEIDTMATDIKVADVGQVVYYYSYFALDAVPIDGLTVTTVNATAGNGATTYTGTVLNKLNVTASNPSIRVFPLNKVGRPLGVAGGTDGSQVPPGGTWTFQTDAADATGVSYAAFPAADFGN